MTFVQVEQVVVHLVLVCLEHVVEVEWMELMVVMVVMVVILMSVMMDC